MAGRRDYDRTTAIRGGTQRRPSARGAYYYGNAVPKTLDNPYQPKYEPEQKKEVSLQVKRNRRQAMNMSRSYALFLAVAAMMMLFVCVNYVQLRSELVSRSKNITRLQQELASLNEENTTRYNAIMDSVNLNEVRERAMNDLGMVYANSAQIIEYDNPTGDFIKQYEQIPEDGVLAASRDIQD